MADLHHGVETYIPWDGTMLAENSCLEGGGEAASGGGGSQSASQDSGELTAVVVYMLTTPWPEGMTGEQVQVDVGYVLDWVTTNISSEERQLLAAQLQDPNLAFANATVEELLPNIVQSLSE